jgi:hypothetical protein
MDAASGATAGLTPPSVMRLFSPKLPANGCHNLQPVEKMKTVMLFLAVGLLTRAAVALKRLEAVLKQPVAQKQTPSMSNPLEIHN